MPLQTVNETAARDLVRLLLDLITPSDGQQQPADAAAHAETHELIRNIHQEIQTMSENITTAFTAQDAKIDVLIAAQTSMSERVSAQDAKLAAAETARDQAVSDLTSTKAALADAQTQLASNTAADIAAVKASLAAEGAKLDGVIGSLNGVDVAPVPAETTPAAPTPASVADPAAAAVELAPRPDAPAAAPAALQQDSQVSLTA